MKKEKGSNATPETQCKDTYFASQYKTVYQSFSERPKTMLEVSIETGILRANICRYIAFDWSKVDRANRKVIDYVLKNNLE